MTVPRCRMASKVVLLKSSSLQKQTLSTATSSLSSGTRLHLAKEDAPSLEELLPTNLQVVLESRFCRRKASWSSPLRLVCIYITDGQLL